MLLRTENRSVMYLSSRQTFKIDLERTGRFYFSSLLYNMSALSLISQFQVLPFPILAGGAGDGVQDIVLTQQIPAGFFIGTVTMTLAGGSVTSGDFTVSYNGSVLTTTILGAVGTNDTASNTFFVVSNGADDLEVAIVGTGGAWTSAQTTLYLRQIA